MHKLSATLAVLCVLGCEASTTDTNTGANQSGVQPEQMLGTDFNNPPEGTQPPAAGPDPAVCLGTAPSAEQQAEAPFGNAAGDGEMSLDWALTDFQPQSCGYEKTYGMAPFKGRVTVLALLAAW